MGTGKGGRRFDFCLPRKVFHKCFKVCLCVCVCCSLHQRTSTHLFARAVKWTEKKQQECTTAHCDQAMSETAPLVIIFSVLQPPRCSESCQRCFAITFQPSWLLSNSFYSQAELQVLVRDGGAEGESTVPPDRNAAHGACSDMTSKRFPFYFSPTTYIQLVVAVANTPCVA